MDNSSKVTVRARDFFKKSESEKEFAINEFRGVLEGGTAIEFEGELFDDFDDLMEALSNYKHQ